MKAVTDDKVEEYKNTGDKIAIDGYSFTIYIHKDGNKYEDYNFESISDGNENKIIINKELKDYIVLTGVTKVYLDVFVINTLVSISSSSTTVGEHEMFMLPII